MIRHGTLLKVDLGNGVLEVNDSKRFFGMDCDI
jgi:hypothetical protein